MTCIGWSYSQVFALVVLFLANINICAGDVDSGCPSWGCLPWGSFSLSSDAPVKGEVQWTTLIDQLDKGQEDMVSRKGCVSDQQTVVCATHNGYVSIDPSNGKQLWNYTTRMEPYLPIMDIYGDVIGMDEKAMYYVGADGKPKRPIPVGILKPSFGLMVGNNSIMILTASTNKTAQIVTYGTDGIVDGAIPLDGNINRVNGTFIPCSQPIIAGHRAYLVTYFYPDNLEHQEAVDVSGMMRLYAIDLLQQMAPRIVVAWYFNFGRWDQVGGQGLVDGPKHVDGLEPIVTYIRGAVYVNMPGNLPKDHKQYSSSKLKQPYPGTLWGIRDNGDGGDLLFRTSCLYGPMAVFDTYDNPLKVKTNNYAKRTPASAPHTIWVMNHSPAMLVGYDAVNGSAVNVTGLNDIFSQLNGWITSRLSITRPQNSTTDPDVLVFGMADSTGQAKLVAIEISSDGQARLRWSTVLAKPKSKDNILVVDGQIVNVALSYTVMDGDQQTTVTWKPGIVAMVTETGSNSITTSAVAVF